MRKSLFIALMFAIPVFVLAGDKYQKMNVKTGLWEVTRIQKTNGQMPFPPGLLAKLSPEQRARFEAKMQAQSGHSETSTYKSCLDQKDLDEGPNFGNKPGECKETLVNSTTSQAEVRFDCELQGMKGTGTFKVEALSPVNVKGSAEIRAVGESAFVSSSTFSAKWAGPNCGGVH